MTKINENYLNLQGSYLFAEVAKRTAAYKAANLTQEVISLGIGDVSQPLVPAVVDAMKKACDEMGQPGTFRGYGPYEGYDFLRKAIAKYDYQARGVNIAEDEIFVSDGAKSDVANFQELFSVHSRVALQDPVYPVYLDTNVMAGRSGRFENGQFKNIIYLPCTSENNFSPDLPQEHADLVYLCSPNNPTGSVMSREELKKWVDWALEHKAVILYDSAYEAFIREENVPHSIFEVEGAEKCAVEFRSFSKTAGFTGTRCAYCVVPKALEIYDDLGNAHKANALWMRRQSTKFNGVPYIIQRGAEAVYSEEGLRQTKEIIDGYLANARVIYSALKETGLEVFGGQNAPYIWLKTPQGMNSWQFFDYMLEKLQIVGTPGSGFGHSGEGYFRLTAFNTAELTQKAAQRILNLK
ncbi:MAG: LL-diaminopimelate aminotransferase [Elusimicrobiaceae bacterium]|nr:LL-diaminopimelate aminotransferase [Elusimicrobiaceae bacterium]